MNDCRSNHHHPNTSEFKTSTKSFLQVGKTCEAIRLTVPNSSHSDPFSKSAPLLFIFCRPGKSWFPAWKGLAFDLFAGITETKAHQAALVWVCGKRAIGGAMGQGLIYGAVLAAAEKQPPSAHPAAEPFGKCCACGLRPSKGLSSRAPCLHRWKRGP